MFEDNMAAQKEFAQHGIRWKVADAQAAGVHPLYALGANTHSFSPTAVGSSDPVTSFRKSGQDIARSVKAGQTRAEREIANINIQAAKVDLQGKELENAIKAEELRKSRQVGPPLPSAGDFTLIDGQGDSVPTANTRVLPVDLSATDGNPSKEAGAVSDFTYARTSNGGLAIVPSKDFKDRTEDFFLPQLMWSTRNVVLPNMSGNKPPYPDPRKYPF